ncbi:MAG TPA: hypothetical protein VH592_26215 [Gemmataceae bacterium]|jgi:hypothetical protein
MPGTPKPQWSDYKRLSAMVVLALVLAGCNSQKQPVYEDNQGFRIMPPPGWVERARDDAIPARSAQRQQNVPLPPLSGPGNPPERFLVRYDRTSTGQQVLLRVSVAEVPSSMSLKACLATRIPGRGWKRESEEESLDVSGLPAARIAFLGRWHDQDYLCETFAVRKKENVYLFSAAFPASDSAAREEVRQAIQAAIWPR